MKVVDVNGLAGTERDVKFNEGYSIRPVLEKDGMGFSVHKTMIRRGTIGRWHYKNHLESCYCFGIVYNRMCAYFLFFFIYKNIRPTIEIFILRKRRENGNPKLMKPL